MLTINLTDLVQSLHTFLDSIEINKQYFRTGIQVKNPHYKNVSDDDLDKATQVILNQDAH